MTEKIKLEKFCVLPNAEHWAEYKDQAASSFDVKTCDVSFSSDPKSFPCLVASKVQVSEHEALKFEVSSCFVYEDDAKLLLSAGVNVHKDFENHIDEMLSEPPWTAGMKIDENDIIPSIEPDLSILVLSMLRELVDVGAIKTDRLFAELKPMTDKIQAFNKLGIDPDSSVTDFIKDLWEAVNKDAS